MITLRITGLPKAQPRPQFTIRNGKVITYTPTKNIKEWLEAIKWQVYNNKPKKPIDFPVELAVRFYMPRPRNHYTTFGNIKENKPYFCDKRPDLDNLIKLLLDALTRAKYWNDDNIIVRLISEKIYTTDGFTGAVVVIKSVEPVSNNNQQ